MKHKNSHLLVGYWSRLRRGRAVPDQTDIDPRAIKRMLPYVFILDVSDVSRPGYRLAGTGLCQRFGYELKGTDFLAGFDPQSRSAVVDALRQALRTKQPVSLSSIGASADCGMVELETVLAPISFSTERATRFIGLTQVLSDTVQLGGRPIDVQRLIATQTVSEDDPVASVDHLPSPPMPVFGRRQTPHLRLVVSNDASVASRHPTNNMPNQASNTLGLTLVTP
jgi:hypothetical protein